MSSPKKRKLDIGAAPSEELIRDINMEIDLEIALRQQLAQTLEARIAWALLLQESIKTGKGFASQGTFRNVAMDALASLETPSNYILRRDPTPPSNTSIRIARPSPRKIYLPNFRPKPSFLYTRFNPATVQQEGNYSHLYILRCPGCTKTTFTSLQGLLNHARLTHNLEWGTHDACIRACAVLDDDLDVEAGIEVGTGPSGVLPGLQTIFQMAVGGQKRGNDDVLQKNTGNEASNQKPPTDGGYLNQTLGLHEDSPALAPFLGKEAIRRQIKVWDEDVDIDMENDEGANSRETQRSKRPWKMSFTARNLAEPSILQAGEDDDKATVMEHVDHGTKHSDMEQPSPAPIVPKGFISHGSRFRFIARIVITDRSLSMPEDQRPDEYKDFTHKWMIAVDAPSYANHITSVLNSVRVTPSDPTLSIPIPPPTTTPPYVVVGVSNKPFLARVELSFSGTSSDPTNQDQKVLFEHWVDLDPIGDRGVVVGQDQILDVELDKNTVLKPPTLGYAPIDSKSHWNLAPSIPRAQAKCETKVIVEDPTLSTEILMRLTKRFPMTAGPRPANYTIPYRLVSSPSYFKTLVMGRRKAIEWGRARAIQASYSEEIQTLQNPALLPLTVARIYSWLSENNHFIQVSDKPQRTIKREISVVKEEDETNVSQEAKKSKNWCRICGMHPSIHLMHHDVKMEDNEESKPKITDRPNQSLSILSSDDSCTVVPRVLQIVKLPKIDAQQLLGDGKGRIDRKNASLALASPRALVSVAEPRLLLYIRRLVEHLGLSKFRPLMKTADDGRRSSLYPLAHLGENRLDVEKQLAPYGLLALVTKSFIRVLVERGLEVANRDKILSTGLSPSKRPKSSNRRASKTNRILTPTHILSGILTRGRGRGGSQDPLDTVVLLCLSKLGVPVDPESLAPSRQGELEPLVKLEES